jgi:hypothetical protein
LGIADITTIPTNGFIDLSFGSAPPLESGDYFMRQNSITYRFLVTRIPERPAVVLLAFGVISIVLSRRAT